LSTVSLTIANQTYALGCEDGQELRLTRLAKKVDSRAREILSQIGPLPEDTLLATTCIVLADELSEKESGVSSEDLEQILKRIKQLTKKLNNGVAE
jgi:cell division protein ZapA